MNENAHAPYAELVDAFIKGWSELTVPASKQAAKGKREPTPQRAYLLFNRWDENPLAQALEQQFPKWVRDRFAVPDRQFESRAEHAPFLLELPEELVLSPADPQGRALREWLTHCLKFTAQQVGERTTKQDFCGVVISPASAQTIVRHWVALGDQRPPYEDESVLLRYQDPRVMQRVWVALSSVQQTRWLGPVTHWWSLVQPWGPINASPEPIEWFHARTPLLPHGTVADGSPRDLFDEAQWFLLSISPQANLLWRSYADHNVPIHAQPDADNLMQMLVDAAQMKLEGLNLEDYVWITWMHAPKEGLARARDWSQPHLAPTLNWIAAQLQDQPDARFSNLFVKATQPQR